MVKSHAIMFVPGWNESMLAVARRSVSCTRPSARSALPLSDIANARKVGTAASSAHLATMMVFSDRRMAHN